MFDICKSQTVNNRRGDTSFLNSNNWVTNDSWTGAKEWTQLTIILSQKLIYSSTSLIEKLIYFLRKTYIYLDKAPFIEKVCNQKYLLDNFTAWVRPQAVSNTQLDLALNNVKPEDWYFVLD